jgi:hypothetical protein
MAKRKTRKDSIPKLIKKLDQVFSRWVRCSAADDCGQVACVTCGHQNHWKKMQAGHFIPRQIKSTRWEEWNVRPQCYACNMFYGGRPQDYRDKLIEELGEEEVQRLSALRHQIVKLDRFELQSMIDDYTSRLKNLDA